MSPSELLKKHLPPVGRHAYMNGAAIRSLVKKLQPGQRIAAHVEQRGEAWRLRMSFSDESGKRVRRGITLPDAETAEWVRLYIREARDEEG
ncbi:MAG: hypothetical protein LUG50_07400 [Planctomycetaceae bacterium]|nr:hypothetical protein [Planctomycetaceae bacterium]